MKIFYYSSHPAIHSCHPSGPGTHIREIIRAFEQLEHKVFALMGCDDTASSLSFPSSTFWGGSVKQVLKKVIPGIIWETVKDYRYLQHDKNQKKILLNELTLSKPDLIYERASYLHTSGAEIANELKIPIVLEFNADLSEEKKLLEGNSFYYSSSFKIIQKQMYQCTKIVTVSTALKNHFVKKFGVPPEKIIVTPNAINPDRIKTNKGNIERLKNKLNIVNNHVIGFVGSIFEYHGVDILIEAFSSMHINKKNLRLLIVGDGRVLNDLKQLSKRLNVFNYIIFTGNVEPKNVFDYIELFDVAVMPQSNWYGSPVKIFEYGALGKAVIAPDNQPVREVMTDGVHGLLIRAEAVMLAEALEKLFSNEEKRKSLGYAFQSKVLSEHTWKKMAEKILSEL